MTDDPEIKADGAPAGEGEEPGEESTIDRVRRLAEELGESAVGRERMASARDRLGQASRSVLGQLNVALADEVAELSTRLAALEERVAALEGKPRRAGGRTGDDTG